MLAQPSHAVVDTVAAERAALEARVQLVRQAIKQNTAPDAEPGLLAQWLNWPNWNNWNNWGNWGNWPNWNNWGNWFNR